MSEGEQTGRCWREVADAFGKPREQMSHDLVVAHWERMAIAGALDRLAADVAAIRAKVDAVAPEDVRHFVDSEKAWVKLVEEQRDAAIRKRDEARAEVERLKESRDAANRLYGATLAEVERLRGEVEDDDRLIDQLIVGNAELARQRDEARAEVEKLRREITAAHKGTGYTPDQSDWLMAGAIDRLAAELAARQADGNSPGIPDSSPTAPQPAAPAAGWLTAEERAVVEDIASMIEQWFKMAWSDIDEKRCAVLRSLLARAGSPPVVEVPVMVFGGGSYQMEKRYRAAMDAAGVAWKEVPRE